MGSAGCTHRPPAQGEEQGMLCSIVWPVSHAWRQHHACARLEMVFKSLELGTARVACMGVAWSVQDDTAAACVQSSEKCKSCKPGQIHHAMHACFIPCLQALHAAFVEADEKCITRFKTSGTTATLAVAVSQLLMLACKCANGSGYRWHITC